MRIDDDDYFEFEQDTLDVSSTFNFTAKFKIVDESGFKLLITKIYKRSLSKEHLIVLENIIEDNFPLTVNDVSGLSLEDYKINKLYDGEFELSYYTNKSFDLYLGGIIEKESK
jgi:hypothetical protein